MPFLQSILAPPIIHTLNWFSCQRSARTMFCLPEDCSPLSARGHLSHAKHVGRLNPVGWSYLLMLQGDIAVLSLVSLHYQVKTVGFVANIVNMSSLWPERCLWCLFRRDMFPLSLLDYVKVNRGHDVQHESIVTSHSPLSTIQVSWRSCSCFGWWSTSVEKSSIGQVTYPHFVHGSTFSTFGKGLPAPHTNPATDFYSDTLMYICHWVRGTLRHVLCNSSSFVTRLYSIAMDFSSRLLSSSTILGTLRMKLVVVPCASLTFGRKLLKER